MGLSFLLHLSLIGLIKAPRIDAWGKEGHFMVCKIAEQFFTENTARVVQELLPVSAGGELASVCSWADEVRFRYRWSSPLHYVNTPGDCHNSKGQEGMCVVGAINNYTTQLQGYWDSSSEYNLTESLMFLSHFMGDVHQPLHAGFEADEGGNTIPVRWYRRKTNLHHVWDDNIIETAMKDFYDNDLNVMIEAIQRNITDGWSDEVREWETCKRKLITCPNTYASESIRLACDYAYKDVSPGVTLGDEYFLSRLPVVVKRIAQAGVRLAEVLNGILDVSEGETTPKISAI